VLNVMPFISGVLGHAAGSVTAVYTRVGGGTLHETVEIIGARIAGLLDDTIDQEKEAEDRRQETRSRERRKGPGNPARSAHSRRSVTKIGLCQGTASWLSLHGLGSPRINGIEPCRSIRPVIRGAGGCPMIRRSEGDILVFSGPVGHEMGGRMVDTRCTEPHPLEGFVDRAEAARILGVKPATLADWAVRGCGPQMVKMGRSVRYEVQALLAYAESRTVTSTAKFGRGA